MPSSLLCRIQAHPSRRDLLPDLLKALEPLYVEVSTHESIPPDPWLGYKQALSNLPATASHVLVLQDDAQPVPGFSEVIPKIAERHFDAPVCLFFGNMPGDMARKARRLYQRSPEIRYAPLQTIPFVPLVACLWPRRKVDEFLRWAGSAKLTKADDGNVGRWARYTRQQIICTIPSIVEHNDHVPSVKGGRPTTWGKDRSRVALFLANDAREFDW